MSDGEVTNNTPWNSPWPDDGLEYLEQCPVCGSEQRELLHENLIDNVFFCAYGKWSLWRCNSCQTGYLDPRPTSDSIHLAYETYYTHISESTKYEYEELTPLRKLRRRLLNGYTNWEYGSSFTPANKMGVLLAYINRSLKRRLDRGNRNLPYLPGGGGRLLDVGCGNGAFLSHAKDLGWDVVGLDLDPKAVSNAVKHGLIVYEGGLEYFSDTSEIFDAITLSHVIEHLHDPIISLEICYKLLNPGGQLWIETPNVDSILHQHFQKNWRGLETPRHLILFNGNSLRQALAKAGFSSISERVRQSAIPGMFKASCEVENYCSSGSLMMSFYTSHVRVFIYRIMELFLRTRREFVTMAAKKPESKESGRS